MRGLSKMFTISRSVNFLIVRGVKFNLINLFLNKNYKCAVIFKMADQIVEMEKSIEKDENSSTEVYPSSRNSQRSGTLFNIFALKKAAAQGMMDVALMTSNANQLRYLMEYGPRSATYHCLFLLIIFSLFLQVIVGIILIMKGRSDFRRRSTFRRQKTKHDIQLNQCVGVGVFLITVVNVFIAAFGVNVASPTMQPVQTSSQTKDK